MRNLSAHSSLSAHKLNRKNSVYFFYPEKTKNTEISLIPKAPGIKKRKHHLHICKF